MVQKSLLLLLLWLFQCLQMLLNTWLQLLLLALLIKCIAKAFTHAKAIATAKQLTTLAKV